ncbi:hypothetical protein OJF2_19550 [Aquisphaera giovannonii]|uniref:Uncharacterized protein n=1 Tax=Aquisphaera giovannonii TaxID=406548 RepID=A0A5B9VYN5_9BACT|nr:hypothetical protein OJF2_19550 [Aquisphaera giovannonii]
MLIARPMARKAIVAALAIMIMCFPARSSLQAPPGVPARHFLVPAPARPLRLRIFHAGSLPISRVSQSLSDPVQSRPPFRVRAADLLFDASSARGCLGGRPLTPCRVPPLRC